MHVIKLTHSTSTGHRIPGHEGGTGKCARLHGHTYEFKMQLTAYVLNEMSMVADFGAVKAMLDEWDHRTLLWTEDPLYVDIDRLDVNGVNREDEAGIVRVPFIPTAEAMSEHLVYKFLAAFDQLAFVEIEVRETTKTAASFYASQGEVPEAMRT